MFFLKTASEIYKKIPGNACGHLVDYFALLLYSAGKSITISKNNINFANLSGN